MQDYKHIHYNVIKRKQETKVSKKLSVFFLLLIALAIAAGVLLQKKPELKEKIEKAIKPNQVTPSQEPATLVRFTFYDILATGEVVLPKGFNIKPTENEIYIQLGAFQDDAAADNFAAELTLKGFNPQTQMVDIPEKSGWWFIVRLGKIESDQELVMLKEQLEQNQIEYAIVSKKGAS